MKGWKYSYLYPRQNTVTETDLDAEERFPTIEEFDCEPTTDEHSKPIDNLFAGKPYMASIASHPH